MFRVTLQYDFDTRAIAEEALAQMEEVGGKHNGELEDADITDLDEEG